MEENRIQKAMNDLVGAIGEALGEVAQTAAALVDGILPCIRCYKFLNCWACEDWLRCNERIERTERAKCFECDGIGCERTRQKMRDGMEVLHEPGENNELSGTESGIEIASAADRRD